MYSVIPKVQQGTYATVTVIGSLIFCGNNYHGIEISRKFQYLRGNVLDGNGIMYFDLNGNGIIQFLW